jgi:dTDP-4-amino-4,6-dideoxygalactose transaminase
MTSPVPRWRACEQDRAACANWLAGLFGRSHGVLVCSGTMALELALMHLGAGPGWRVVVPRNSCPQVPAAVLRSGGIPVIVDPGDDLVLTPRALAALEEPPDAVIALHGWGLPCPLAALRASLGASVPLIEDAAQAWLMHPPGSAGAMVADVVVTSMGANKPLCIGDGGAAFAEVDLQSEIDTRSSNQRARSRPAMAIALSKYALPHIAAAVARVDARTERLRALVPALLDRLAVAGLATWFPPAGSPPSWHFVPVRADDRAAFMRLRHAPEADALGVCAPVPLDGMAMLAEGAQWLPARHPAQGHWLLLDPQAALAYPDLIERWAERARS